MIIRNGTVYDAVHEKPYVADIVVRGGKIASIGETMAAEENEHVIDAAGMRVYPGLVEAHCHVGLHVYGLPGADCDVNERNDITSAHLRAIDGFNPFDPGLRKALEAGITTIGTGPGSASVVGGTFMAVKTRGTCVDDMLVKNNVAMKCALGENPKNCYGGKCDSTRMSTAAKLRELLFAAKEYSDECLEAIANAPEGEKPKMPKHNMKLAAMRPVMEGEIPLKIHAHRADDICTAIRIAKEFGVKLTIEHCTEGHLIVNELARAGVPVAVGPSMTNASKIELANKSFETPGILARAGVQVSIITDAPVIVQEYLPLCAGLAVKAGMDPFAALQAITIHPAKHLGIEDRVGSIEVGKDADLVITDGDIMVSDTKVMSVIMDGEIAVG